MDSIGDIHGPALIYEWTLIDEAAQQPSVLKIYDRFPKKGFCGEQGKR